MKRIAIDDTRSTVLAGPLVFEVLLREIGVKVEVCTGVHNRYQLRYLATVEGGGPVDHQIDRLEGVFGDDIEQETLPVRRNIVVRIDRRLPG